MKPKNRCRLKWNGVFDSFQIHPPMTRNTVQQTSIVALNTFLPFHFPRKLFCEEMSYSYPTVSKKHTVDNIYQILNPKLCRSEWNVLIQ